MNDFITLFFHILVSLLLLTMILWGVWMRLMTDMNFLMCKCRKSMHLSFQFFHMTMHSPFGFVHWSDEEIAGHVHWFLTFAQQQIHIHSLTSNQAHALHLSVNMQFLKDVLWPVFNQAIISHNVSCPSVDENDYKV